MRTLIELIIICAAAIALTVLAAASGAFSECPCSHEKNQTQINLANEKESK